jgi:DNA-binding cell septation regulator SpoVG
MVFSKNQNANANKSQNADAIRIRITCENLRSVKAVVRNVRQVADNCLTFTLRISGIDLYGMRLVDGKKGRFITASSTKGKNGNYYENYRVYLDDSGRNAVETAVLKAYYENTAEVEV